MKEVFQTYEHYANWILENWQEKSEELNNIILQSGLLIERINNCTGETHRYLSKEEFLQKETKGFIFIPSIN